MEKETKPLLVNEDICICCGKPIPEGRMICKICEIKITTEPAERKLGNICRK